MLLELLVAGASLVILSLLVTLEVAALESRRTFLPDTFSDRASSDSEVGNVPVADFLFCARVVATVLLLILGALTARIWATCCSSRTTAIAAFLAEGSPITHYVAAGLIVMCGLALTVVVGIIVPIQVAQRFPEKSLSTLAPLGRLVVRIVWPILCISNILGRATFTTGEDSTVAEEGIEEDIRSLVAEGERAGVIEEEERKIITRVFKLGDKPLASLMTPRSDVVFLRSSMTKDEALRVVLEARYTWYPVLNGDSETVLGVVSAHDVYELTRNDAGQGFGLKAIVTTATDVPESMTALELLALFKEQGGRFAVVRDEYGMIAGIATIDDILKVIVGELASTTEEDRSIIPRDDGSFLVDASSDVQNLFEFLGCTEQESGEQAPFHSVGGFVMSSLGRIPKEGDYFEHEGYRFEVIDMDGKRIDKVLVRRSMTKTAVGV